MLPSVLGTGGVANNMNDYNHYGTPKNTEDTWSVPGHSNVLVRYQAVIQTNNGGRFFRLSHP